MRRPTKPFIEDEVVDNNVPDLEAPKVDKNEQSKQNR
jgi:hypothetical protein